MTGLPWFRAYSRMIDDHKLRLLAFEDRWHFVALCCLKCEGLLDTPDTELRSRSIAVRLGVQVRELDEISRRLREVGLVDDLLNPVAWESLQYRSDSSAKRVREYRERKKKQGVSVTQRDCNVTETAQDTDTDTEKEDTLPKVRVSKRAARADEFPMPEFADPGVWRDFLRNRKTKGLPNTQTAHGKMLADIDKLVARTGWPPGDILKACTAKGWGAIYETDEMKGNENGSQGRTYRSAAERPSGWLS